nr:PREDICTED: U11/U12 small nuclear ribonucleoprotein 48 kDa protein [Opisthocomus hoazin]
MELNLATDVKNTKRGFYKCIGDNRKTMQNVGPWRSKTGDLVTQDMEKAERECDRLEYWANRILKKFNKDKDLQFHILKQARAQSAKEGGSYSEDDSQKGPKSHLEILAEMRDYKRRRQSYRAKNVHITKKSYTEVIRDVIGVHMEELSHHWQEESKLDNAEICEGGKPKSSGREDRRSASVDSRQSGGSCKDTERARHRRESSRSPNKRKRSRERGKDRDSRRKRERDEDKYHSHKRRK